MNPIFFQYTNKTVIITKQRKGLIQVFETLVREEEDVRLTVNIHKQNENYEIWKAKTARKCEIG